ncbi:RNA 3'-phosphate cyclase [Thermosulfurimonas marina]|uniref:RNA 3'-terminal phosphate cyclase n=1 Tax=Thermosulfurimonas marina TaxID=2047767 RepID=A0A6H1WTC6_9BACT|nr:RNA 3'-terminal phosphate cyclase [Thermosulfurimonas marina]QJA06467.1 RNA 3'-phosphate cyclase [Thermosulfurimonas marina]
MLILDGSYGEGGGQILRTALTLSLLTGRSFRLVNIRAGRPRPGLRPQHLACVLGAARLSGAEVEGAEKGSREIVFRPRAPRPGAYTLEIGTAGATSLLFQTLYLPLAQAGGGRLILRGGTHVPQSPCFHYLAEVFWPLVETMGLSGRLTLRKYGFYPRGGGEILAEIGPARELRGLDLGAPLRPEVTRVFSFVTADLPEHIRRRQASRAEKLLREAGLSVEVRLEKAPSASPGTFVGVVGQEDFRRAGVFALGARGKPAEKVAEEAVGPYLQIMERASSVDQYLADQLLLPAALAKGLTRFRTPAVTRHLLTNAWVIRQFLPEVKIEIQGAEGEPGEVMVHGSGTF